MSDWRIEIPHRSRDESLIDVASNCRGLADPEQRRVAREVVIGARLRGFANAGQLIDHLASLTREQRRELIDEARAECRLPPTAEVDERRRIEARRKMRVPAPEIIGCAVEGCDAIAMSPTGTLLVPDCRRWHCDQHRHLAAPGDLDPVGSGLKISPSGAIVPADPDPRELAAERTRRAENQARDAQRAAEAGALREREAAEREAFERELPAHLRLLVP